MQAPHTFKVAGRGDFIKSFLFGILFMGLFSNVLAQTCSPDLLQGQNLVRNGDFSDDYADWYHATNYVEATAPSPGHIYVGTDAKVFNQAFLTYPDHSPTADGKFLMVDGACQDNVVLWGQENIPVIPNTRYYFGVWISTLKNAANNPGTFQLYIDDEPVGPTYTAAKNDGGHWALFEQYWDSEFSSGNVKIEIKTVSGAECNNELDFAIDDVSFIPGCAFATTGPQPDLGPDVNICGVTGNLTLEATLPGGVDASTTVTWSTGATPDGSNKLKATVSQPGKYAICVKKGSSCTVSDVIVVNNTFKIALPNLELCSPASTTLDAGSSGPNVSYKWYKNNVLIPDATSRSYFVNEVGAYKVEAVDNTGRCQPANATANITTKAVAKPVNKTFCNLGNVTLSVTPAGTQYDWYTTATGNTLATASSGTATNTSSFTFNATDNTEKVFYVQDKSFQTSNVGPTTLTGTADNGGIKGVRFTTETPLTITGMSIMPFIYSAGSQTFTFDLTNLTTGTKTTFSADPIDITTLQNSAPFTAYPITFSTPISVPTAGNYLLEVSGSTQVPSFAVPGWGYQLPDVIQFLGNNNPSDIGKINQYPGFFNWQVSHQSVCDRIPVKATHACPPCNPPATVIVSSSPAATAKKVEVCSATGNLVTLSGNYQAGTGTNANGTYQYVWYKKGTTPGAYTTVTSTTAAGSKTLTAADSGTWVLRVEDGSAGNSSCFEEDEIEFVVKPIPVASASSNSPVCVGEALNLTGGSDVANSTFTWTGPNTYTSSTQSPSIANATTAMSGTYSLTAIAAGCSSTVKTVTVSVLAPPTATPSNNGPLCTGNTFNLTAATVAGASYAWTGPNSFVSNQQNPSLPNATLPMAGTYSLTVKVGNCTATATTTLVVTNSVTPTVSLALSEDTLCGDGTKNITLTATGTGGGNVPKYTFRQTTAPASIVGVNEQTQNTATFQVPANTSTAAILYAFTVEMESDLGCITSGAPNPVTSAAQSLTVDAQVLATYANITETKATVCTDGRSLTTPASPGSTFTTTWTTTNGATVSNGNLTGIPQNAQTLTTYKVESPLKLCPSRQDTVTTIRLGDLTSAIDVAKQSDTICLGDPDPSLNTSMLSPLKDGETGAWAVVSPTLAQISSTGQTSNLQAGDNVFSYTISTTVAGCPPSIGKVTIKVVSPPVANITNPAGTTLNINATSYQLTASAAGTGYTGNWSNTGQGTIDQMGNLDGLTVKETNPPTGVGTSVVTWEVKDNLGVCDPAKDVVTIVNVNRNIADAGPDQRVCQGTIVTLTGNGTSLIPNIETASWTGVPVGTASGNIVTIPGNVPAGRYTFTYLITNSVAGNTTDNVTVQIDEATTTPTLTETSPHYICSSDYILPGVANSQVLGKNWWEIISGTGTLPPNDSTATPNLTGISGQVALKFWHKNGVCPPRPIDFIVEKVGDISPATAKITGGKTDLATKQYTNFDLVTAPSQMADTLCVGGTYALEAGAFNTTTEEGLWTVVDGTSVVLSNAISNPSQTFTPSTVGTTTLKWEVKSKMIATCAPNSITLKLVVNDVPQDGNVIGTPVCEGDTANFSVTGVTSTLSGVVYEWDEGALPGAQLTIANGTTASYLLQSDEAGTITTGNIQVNTTNRCGTSNVLGQYNILLRPHNFTVDFVSPTLQICASDPGPVPYTVTVSPAAPAGTDYNWYWNNQAITASGSSLQLTSLDYSTKTGIIPLQVKLKNECGEAIATDKAWSAELPVEIQQSKPLGVTIAPVGDNKVCVPTGGTKTFNATPETNGNTLKAPTYEFYTGTANTPDTSNATGIFNAKGLQDSEEVRVLLKDPMGCFDAPREATASMTVEGFEYPLSTIMPKYGILQICETDEDISLSVNRTTTSLGNYNDKGIQWYKDGSLLPQYIGKYSISLGEPSESGNYTVRVLGSVCPDSSSKDLTWAKIYEKPEFSFAPDPLFVEYQDGIAVPLPLTLIKPVKDTITYHRYSPDYWLSSADSLYAVFVPKREEKEIDYTLTVKTKLCTTEGTIKVINALPLRVPNAFSPNGDGLNETWVIDGLGRYSNVRVNVYNRWGSRVFLDKEGYRNPWDGTTNGTPLQSGTYYYVIELTGSADGKERSETGSLTIVK